MGFPSGCLPEKQVCSAAYLLETSRLLVLLGGLNLFAEERLRYFHVFIPSLQCMCDRQVGNTVRYRAAEKKEIAAGMDGTIL